MKFALRATFWMCLVAGPAVVHAADPVPYDSIANPLSELPTTVTNIQQMGDTMNRVPGRVRVNQAGYRLADIQKGWGRIYYVDAGSAKSYTVINGSNLAVATGPLTSRGQRVQGRVIPFAYYNAATPTRISLPGYNNATGMAGSRATTGTLDQGFLPTTLPWGRYRVVVGTDTSEPFIVSDNVYGMARDAAIKFFGVARSGEYQSWFHPASHMWDGWLYDSAARNPDGTYKYKGALTGGWYDCGNHLKESRTMSYSLAALGMLAATMHDKDVDHYALNQANTQQTDGIPDVLREAWVGSQFALKSWRLAQGNTANMYLSVGNPPGGSGTNVGVDFLWWGRPENQDMVTDVNRGGANERNVVKNWGTPSMADWAAGLAFVSRMYRPYDPKFADTALIMAKAMYAQAKKTNALDGGSDYNGETIAIDDLAAAAVALLWATHDTTYLNDVAYRPGMVNGTGGTCAASNAGTALNRFNGGYFGCGSNGIIKSSGTSWGNIESFSLYSLIKLILVDPDTAQSYGIAPAQRDTLLLRSLNNLIGTELSGGGKTFTLPIGVYSQAMVSYDSLWYNMNYGSGVPGYFNKYEFGHFADLYMYWDATSIVDQKPLLNVPATPGYWMRDTVQHLLVDGLDYMFGMNAMDLSYLMGVGHKNPNHPHHRAANPEGKNVPGAYYNYSIPVGGLWGGPAYSDTVVKDLWENQVSVSEANCPDASAAVMIPLMGLSRAEPVVAPVPTVSVLSTSDTSAVIQVNLNKYGFVKIGYGTDSTGNGQSYANSTDSGVTLRVTLDNLTPGTKYYFSVTASDVEGDQTFSHAWVQASGDSILYNFTTLSTAPTNPTYSNIKVCNVTADSAEVMWVTPNGVFQSSVIYDDSADWVAGKRIAVDTDETGPISVEFHRVLLTGLKEQTTYYFQVGVPGSHGSVVGCFRTPVEDVKFDIRASRYNWPEGPDNTYTGSSGSVMRALSLGVTNQDSKSYDSLMLRIYLRGTKYYPDSMVDFGARCDIGFAYMSDGYIDSGFESVVDQALRVSFAQKVDSTCSDSSVCDWYFTIPLYDSASDPVMESQARFRLDVLFDTHKYEINNATGQYQVYTDLMNHAPAHDPFAVGTKDWSFRIHVAGADNGLSPVNYAGVPFADKNALDDSSQNIPVEPYVAVYRKNTFVYGYSPSATEQATKRTVYAMNVAFDPPFNQQNGAPIVLSNGARTINITGTADVYDQLMPAAKGYITSIWINGTALAPPVLSSAISKQADGTWKFDIPVTLASGTNNLNVTIFAGSDSADTTPTGTCQEGNGCAFAAREWLVNSVSNRTASALAIVDASNATAGPRVTPDSSQIDIRVVDGDNNLMPLVKDTVLVTLTDLRTGQKQVLKLVETGIATGIFESGLLPVTSGPPVAGKISVLPGDSVLVKYVDVNDATDSSQTYLYAKARWPVPVHAGIFRDCGGNYSVQALFNPVFATSGWDTARVVLHSGLDSVVEVIGPSAISSTGGSTIVFPVTGVSGSSLTGRFSLQVANGTGGWITESVTVDDSIGPWVDSAKIVQNLAGNPKDSLFFWTSEPVVLGTGWPFLVERAGTAVPASAFSGAAISLLDAVTDKYLAVLPAGILMAGDSVRFDPSLVADGKGNAALDCPGGRKVQTISVSYAGLGASLTEACGGAYSVKALFNKAFPATGGWDTGFVTLSSGTTTVGPFAVPPGSISMDATGKTLTLPLPGLNYGSRWTGRLDLQVTGDTGAMHLVSVPVSDGVGPWIDSAKIVQNLTGNPVDSVLVFASEPLVLSSGWPFLVERAGSAVPASAFAGANISLLDTASNKYLVLLPAGDLASGDSLRLAPASATDRVGNAALDCPSLLRRVTLVVRPAPLGKAWILDASGDGRADQVVLVFKKTVTATDLPDSVVIRFGIRDSSRTVAVSMAQATDSILTIPLPVPFSFGLTSGSAADGSGSISLWKSGEPVGPYVLSDSVGPALVSAAVRYGSTTDTLSLVFSEPVRRGAGAGWLLAQPATELGTSGAPDSLSPTQWLLPIVAGSVSPGDSVRPVPTEQWAEGRTGRSVAPAQPWIPVTGGERPPLYGWYRDIDGNGAVDQAVVVFSKTPKTRPGMLLLWPSAANGFDTAKVDSGSWNLNPDGLSTTIPVGPFAEGVTASPTTKLGQWLSGGVWNFPMYDSVPPVLVSATVRYGSRDSVPDTLHVRWSEPIDWNGAGSLVRHRLAGVENPVLAVNGIPDADGMGEMILMASDTLQLRKGDSAAFSAGSVTDLHGNVVPQTTRWVPVTFGMRPVQISFVFQSYMEYTGWDPPSGPAMQVWVRARGDAVWLRTDGSVVSDTTHMIGATITINNPIGGSVYIYDNAGIFVASLDLSPISALDARGLLPTDPSGMYQIRIGWDGMTEGGNWASSGIYLMRIVLKGAGLHGGTTTGIFNQVYKLGFKRPTK